MPVQTSGGVDAEGRPLRRRRRADPVSALLYVPAERDGAASGPGGAGQPRLHQHPRDAEPVRHRAGPARLRGAGHGHDRPRLFRTARSGPARTSAARRRWRYLQSPAFVDKANIGLEGHSMGGVPVVAAAASPARTATRRSCWRARPPAFLGATAPAHDLPHNLAVVFGQYDEFAPLMWGVPKGSLVGQLGEAGQGVRRRRRRWSSARSTATIADGSARVLENPPVDHPLGALQPRPASAAAVDWFQQTLTGEAHPLPPADQIWLWKEIGTADRLRRASSCLLLGTFELLLADAGRSRACASRPARGRAARRASGGWPSRSRPRRSRR